MNAKKVALYARISTTEQRADLQLDGLRKLAEQRGWRIVEEYVDIGISGSKDRRPALDRLMADARRGRFSIHRSTSTCCGRALGRVSGARALSLVATIFDA